MSERTIVREGGTFCTINSRRIPELFGGVHINLKALSLGRSATLLSRLDVPPQRPRSSVEARIQPLCMHACVDKTVASAIVEPYDTTATAAAAI